VRVTFFKFTLIGFLTCLGFLLIFFSQFNSSCSYFGPSMDTNQWGYLCTADTHPFHYRYVSALPID